MKWYKIHYFQFIKYLEKLQIVVSSKFKTSFFILKNMAYLSNKLKMKINACKIYFNVGMSQKQFRLNSLTGLSVWLLGCSRMFYMAFLQLFGYKLIAIIMIRMVMLIIIRSRKEIVYNIMSIKMVLRITMK